MHNDTSKANCNLILGVRKLKPKVNVPYKLMGQYREQYGMFHIDPVIYPN